MQKKKSDCTVPYGLLSKLHLENRIAVLWRIGKAGWASENLGGLDVTGRSSTDNI